MSFILLTIFTPTYNRAYTLVKLYESLLLQTNKQFIWLIVDDGSTDDTDKTVENWISENKLKIEYIKQENSGKHIAHNTGVLNCNTDFFFCVDSDDYLLNTAIEDIYFDIEKTNCIGVSGIISQKLIKDKEIAKFLPDMIGKYASLSDLYEKHGLKGDTSLVFKTEVLKKYLFPKITGEKFVGEEYVYCQIDEKYKLYVSDKKYYVYEYLADGYTSNMAKLIAQNPKGYTELKRIKFRVSNSFKIKYKAAALYLVGCKLSRDINWLKNSPNKFISILAVPLAAIVYFVRFRKFG